MQVTQTDQHVEVDGRLWHNGIVLSNGEVMNPGGGWKLTKRNGGKLFPGAAFTGLLDHCVTNT